MRFFVRQTWRCKDESGFISTFWNNTVRSVNVLGVNGLKLPSTVVRPYLSTRPSNLSKARLVGSEEMPVTPPLKSVTWVAKGSTRLKSAKSTTPFSTRTRSMFTGKSVWFSCGATAGVGLCRWCFVPLYGAFWTL